MKKKILTLALVLVLTFTLFPISALASDEFNFTIPDWVVEIRAVKGIYLWNARFVPGGDMEGVGLYELLMENGYTMGTPLNLTIPSSVEVIDEFWTTDSLLSDLKHLTLLEGFKEVSDNAFVQCRNLESITLPSSLTRIGKNAFENSALTSVVLPNSVQEIGRNAFAGCKNLESVVLPSGLKIIDYGAFSQTALKQVVVPSGVERIAAGAFENFTLTDLTIPPSVVSIDKKAVFSPENPSLSNFTAYPTIHGVKGSAAEKFAVENKLKFNAISMPDAQAPSVPATSAAVPSYTEAKAYFDKKFNINLVIDWSDLDKNSATAWDMGDIGCFIEDSFTVIPKELHNALVAHFKAKGQTITLRFDLTTSSMEKMALGTYNHKTATITMYSLESVFAHEYGHMLHYVLNEKYGTNKFLGEWSALNDGILYDQREAYYDDIDYERLRSHFIDMGNYIDPYYYVNSWYEDIAATYDLFASAASVGSRILHEEYKDTSVLKKAMLLDKVASSALKISSIYHPYSPQTPSTWAADAVNRAFSNSDGLLGGFNSAPNCYQYPIDRASFCDYLLTALNKAYEKEYGKPLITGSYGSLKLLNPATGEYNYASQYSAKPLPRFYDWTTLREYVPIAAYYGIVTGTGNGTFDPYSPVTREQAAVILHRAAVLLGMQDTGTAPSAPADAANISNWAVDGVSWAMRNGIMSGTGGGNFSPKDTYSVEQAIVTLVRLFDRP